MNELSLLSLDLFKNAGSDPYMIVVHRIKILYPNQIKFYRDRIVILYNGFLSTYNCIPFGARGICYRIEHQQQNSRNLIVSEVIIEEFLQPTQINNNSR